MEAQVIRILLCSSAALSLSGSDQVKRSTSAPLNPHSYTIILEH